MNKINVIKISLLLGFTLLLSTLINSEEWSSSGRDSVRQRTTNEKLSFSLSQLWQYSTGSGIVSSPAVADGVVVFGGRDNLVRALKESDGTLLWSFTSGDPSADGIYASPCVEKGKVYVPSSEGKIYCLRLSDGSFVWDYWTGGADFSSPLVVPSGIPLGITNTMYVGSGYPNNKVMAINALTKQLVWEKPLEQIVYSSPAYPQGGNKVIVGCDSGRYYALDKTNGAEIWSYSTGGNVLLSSPLVIGNSVYLLPGGANYNFYSVDIDQANWGAQNWQIAIPDSNQPVGVILGTKLATSSPMKVGSLVAFVVRFDYSLDTNADDMPDQYILNEYMIAVNPASHLVEWQKSLGSRITSDQNKVPAFGLCPTPASMLDMDSNPLLVVCSSLTAELKIVNPSDGQGLASYPLDGATRSSPAIANSRVYVATENGSLYAFQCDNNHAPATVVSGFSPSNNANIPQNPIISWNDAIDLDESPASLVYEVRVDDDGEILETYDFITTTTPGVASIILSQSYPDDTRLTYAVRVIDSNLAYSAWSTLQTFWVGRALLAPIPPGNFQAMPGNTIVELSWSSSPSTDVNYYLVSWTPVSVGTYGAPVSLANNVTNYTVQGLTNGVEYRFRIIVQDYDLLESTPIEINSMPAYPVMLNSTPYDTFVNALNNAQSGDTIRLGAGIVIIPYTLEVKEGINIIGYSPHHTIINATGLARGLSVVAGNGTKGVFSNFTIYGAQIGIDAGSYAVSVKNTVIRNCNIAVLISSGAHADVVNNTIIHNNSFGMQTASDNISIRNNIIMYNGYGIYSEPGKTPSISYNNVYGNTHDYQNCSAGTGDISGIVLFEDEPNNYYLEAQYQLTIDMGDPADDWSNEPDPHGGRVNMGAYGNTVYAVSSGPFHIATTSLSDTESGAYYSARISTGGGSPPVTWTITSGVLPPGLSLNFNTGDIAGTVQPGNSGMYDFSVQAVDTLSNVETANFTIIVSQASSNELHIVTNVLSDGEVRTSYYALVSAASGFPPYTWSVIDGSLPYGLALNPNTGEIAGTVPYGMEGRYLFTIRAVDSDSFSVSKEMNILINAGFATGSSGKGKGGKGCFIATAAFGSPLAPAVNVLRRFRDMYLITNKIGGWLVGKYYEYSPPLANYIATHKWAKLVTQIALLPVVTYGWYMTATGILVKILTCLLIIIAGIIIFRHRRQAKRA